jgi:Na+/glutamate symporter
VCILVGVSMVQMMNFFCTYNKKAHLCCFIPHIVLALFVSSHFVSLSMLRLSNVFVHCLFTVQAEMHVDHIQPILLQN